MFGLSKALYEPDFSEKQYEMKGYDSMSNPNNKIGIKTLTEGQIKRSLPNYEMIDSRIEEIRKEASKVKLSRLRAEPFEALKYDQFFSILGGRGAGKTSIIYSLYEKYKKREDCIVLPIIMPELFEDGEGVLDWLLEAMDNKLCEIEDGFKKSGVRYGKDNSQREICEKYKIFDRCAFNPDNQVRKSFRELKNAYYTRNYRFRADSYVEAREWTSRSVESSFSLMRRFVDFWCDLVEMYSLLLNDSNEKGTTPLIIVFIDDADLRPQIVNQLIYSMQKYMSHPNLVVFINASQKILKYAVKNYMYRSITDNRFDLPALMDIEYKYNWKTDSYYERHSEDDIIRFQDLRYGKEYDKINRLTDELLRKLLPVNNRFFLKKYESYDEKAMLIRVEADEEDDQKEINLSLEESVYRCIRDFYEKTIDLHKKYEGRIDENLNKEGRTVENGEGEPSEDTIEKKETNFQLINTTENKLGSRFYLSFFSLYPRDILGVYHSLEELLDELYFSLNELYKDLDRDKKEKKYQWGAGAMPDSFIITVRDNLMSFLDSVISSNRNLIIFSRYERELIKTQLLHWQLFVDYEKVLEVFNDSRYREDNNKHPEAFFEMLGLLNFIEQIIVLLIPQRRKTHVSAYFNRLIEDSRISVIKESNDPKVLFDQFYLFKSLNLIPNFNVERVEHQVHFIKGVERLGLIEKKTDVQEINKSDAGNADARDVKVIDRKWNELYAEVLDKYKDVLDVVPDVRYMGHEYIDLKTDYEERIRTTFFGKTEKDDLSSVSKINTDEFYYDAIELQKLLKNMELKVTDTESFEFVKTAFENVLDDEIRDRLEWFVNVVLNEEPFLRDDLEFQLNSLKREAYDRGRMRSLEHTNWISFYNRLEYQLRDRIIFVKENKEYENVMKRIEKISNGLPSYIAHYRDIIVQKIIDDNGEDMNLYNEMKKVFSEELDVIKNRYWNRYLEQRR